MPPKIFENPQGQKLYELDDHVGLIQCAPEIDPHTAPFLSQAVIQALTNPATSKLVIDLSDTKFMDASGISVLVAGTELAYEGYQDFIIRNPNRFIQRLFSIVSLDEKLTIELASPANPS